MTINEKIFEGLNADQLKVAKHTFGPCFVTAGPGSGKTFVLVRKIANAIQNGVEPSSIVLFTFTTKAAKEIKERVEMYVGHKAKEITIGTYHSVCCRILRRFIHHLGYDKHFTILDSEDSLKIISELCKGTHLDARSIMSYISKQKRHMISYTQAVEESLGLDEKRASIYRDYEIRLKMQNSLDFDNLILLTVKLLSENSEVQKKLHDTYHLIIGDEAQDSSPMDLAFIRLLVNDNHNLTLVGDLDQSIYSFRGTNTQAVIDFISEFEALETFALNQNYRSSQTIVEASRTLINKNPEREEKQLFSANEIGDKVIYAEDPNPEAEALRIANFIRLMQQNEYQVPYSDIAVLYRTNMQCYDIEKALLKVNIPYRILGHVNFYSRKEIKDLLSYLKFAANPYDFEALKRAIHTPKRGIGQASLQKIYDYACTEQIHLLEAINDAKAIKLSKKAHAELTCFYDLITVLREVYLFMPPCEALAYLLTQINYESTLEGDKDQTTRLFNIRQLQELSTSYATLSEMLEQSSLNSDDLPNENKVTLMTMHASKGLEFECVVIAGCNEELVPFVKAIEAGNIEEERRTFYVACTRAKKYLFMTRSKSLLQNGRYKPMRESRFIKEIAEEFIFKIPIAK